MLKFESKISWILKSLLHFLVVCLRTLLYCIIKPRVLFDLLFSFYSTMNESYQVSHGKLLDFDETELSKKIKSQHVFARSNYFNMDIKVMRPVEIQILAGLTNYLKPQTVFEIGTYGGFTTLHFCYNTDESAKIYTLDLPPDYVPSILDNSKLSYDDKLVIELSQSNIDKRAFKGTIYEQKVVELFGDSKNFDYSEYKNKIDLIFIDGNHSYEYVKSDTEKAFEMLSDRGVILWHDFDYIVHKEVFKYLNELSKSCKIYSIRHTRFAIFSKNIQ